MKKLLFYFFSFFLFGCQCYHPDSCKNMMAPLIETIIIENQIAEEEEWSFEIYTINGFYAEISLLLGESFELTISNGKTFFEGHEISFVSANSDADGGDFRLSGMVWEFVDERNEIQPLANIESGEVFPSPFVAQTFEGRQTKSSVLNDAWAVKDPCPPWGCHP